MFRIYKASPQAVAKVKPDAAELAQPTKEPHYLAKYPWDKLSIGECFVVPIDNGKEWSLRHSAVKHGKDKKKAFTVIVHRDQGIVEVARVG